MSFAAYDKLSLPFQTGKPSLANLTGICVNLEWQVVDMLQKHPEVLQSQPEVPTKSSKMSSSMDIKQVSGIVLLLNL